MSEGITEERGLAVFSAHILQVNAETARPLFRPFTKEKSHDTKHAKVGSTKVRNEILNQTHYVCSDSDQSEITTAR